MKDMKKMIDHLREHQEFPATKEEIMEACENLDMDNFSEEDKKWLEEHLQDKTYNSPEDVMQALGWKSQTAQAM